LSYRQTFAISGSADGSPHTARHGAVALPSGTWQRATDFWLRISMDRISDSDSEDAGSIPAGATLKQLAIGQLAVDNAIEPSAEALFLSSTARNFVVTSHPQESGSIFVRFGLL
jgi:hypothetical protein